MIKLLIGGSPCTFWSIAQKNNRETEAEGLGWELFRNYLIAKEKFKPDFFLYENNKSAAKPIKEQIKHELNVWDGTIFSEDSGARYIEINSALVSAQNRQRFYVHNCGEVEQPDDRGILLTDILESGVVAKEKSYCLKHQAGNIRDHFKKHHTDIAYMPVRVGTIESDLKNLAHDSKQYRVYSPDGKATTLCGQGGGVGAKTGLYATPVNTCGDKAHTVKAQYYKNGTANFITNKGFDATAVAESIRIPPYGVNDKSRPIDALYANHSGTGAGSLEKRLFSDNPNKQQNDLVAEPIRVGEVGNGGQGNRIYCVDGKSVSQTATSGGIGSNTGLYAVPFHGMDNDTKCRTLTANYWKTSARDAVVDCAGGRTVVVESRNTAKCVKLVYEVKNGFITIKDKQYPIKLSDGFYIIRKLTVTECCRLQTMPDDYCRAVSNSQAYKGLGNGWTAEVIIHILNGALKNIPRDEEIVVLSMYDGIGTGRYCLDKMGFTNVKYYAYEIDKYAKQIALSNYPDIIQMGDAFDVRNPDWTIGY